jgi:hypothetical protein
VSDLTVVEGKEDGGRRLGMVGSASFLSLAVVLTIHR